MNGATRRLPWQLGADFFLRHLHDGDAASNTLSWRWVAGLHTRGKNYLVRRSNVEKYVHRDLLEPARAGIEKLEGTTTVDLAFEEPPPPKPVAEPAVPSLGEAWGLWMHDEDLLLENSPLAASRPSSIAAFLPTGIYQARRFSPAKREFLRLALDDGATRAGEHFGIEPFRREAEDLPEAIADWARDARLDSVVALRPFVGPLADRLEAIEDALARQRVRLVLVRRGADVAVINKATAGFFGFWKKTEKEREAAIAALEAKPGRTLASRSEARPALE